VTGGQKRTLRLLEAMARAGLEPLVLTPDPSARTTLRRFAVEVVEDPPPTLAQRLVQHAARRPSPYLARLADRLAELAAGAALVQLEHTQSAYYAAPAGVPLILSLHNHDSAAALSSARRRRTGSPAWLRERNRAAALRHVERRALPRAERVLVVSEADGAAVRALGGRPLLAPNGVDDEFFAVPGGGTHALFFGGFGYAPNRLGLERFLQGGWPETRRRVPDARLAVAGAGIDSALRERLAGVEGVDVLGLVDDLPAAMAAARAVLIPIWEGGGTRLKALEGLAAGRPLASTTLGVAGIGFRAGAHGLLGDSPQELGRALAELLADPARAAALGAAGRGLAAGYRWADALAEAERLYAALA
jgi:glycosyltransferase involved in cell wall biosynthesis